MRFLILVGWLLVAILAVAYHYGPGQERLRLDDIAEILAKGDRYVANQEWAKAVGAYEDALKLLPADRLADSQRIRLERAKAQMLAKQLPAAHADLKSLVDELNANKGTDPVLLAQARSTLANSQYYMTWLMRLEGLSKDMWGPEIEASRQEYRLLAEQAESAGDNVGAKKHREDLEATIRLARLDLGELQGLPLPSQ